MCRLYKRDDEPSYVRLCARTGQRGRRVPWSEAGGFVDEGFGEDGGLGTPGCLHVGAYERSQAARGLSPDGRTLRLRLPPGEEDIYAGCLREVLRWQEKGTRSSYDSGTCVLTLEREEPWLDVGAVLARAESFDWRPAAAEPAGARAAGS